MGIVLIFAGVMLDIACFAIGSGTNAAAAVCAALFFLLTTALYFAPCLIAAARGQRAAGQIAILNLFAGWTLLGWVVALVWAYAPRKELAA